MDKIISIGCILLLGFFGLAQEIEQGVPWSEDIRLAWADFKGKVPPAEESAATTASGISYSYSANLLHHEVHLDFEVNAYFYPNESWYKPELCNTNTLAHEQLHLGVRGELLPRAAVRARALARARVVAPAGPRLQKEEWRGQVSR